jgi:hypothetical protein
MPACRRADTKVHSWMGQPGRITAPCPPLARRPIKAYFLAVHTWLRYPKWGWTESPAPVLPVRPRALHC